MAIKQLLKTGVILVLAGLSWFFWQKPAVMPVADAVHIRLPEINKPVLEEQGGWHVLSRRMVTRMAVDALQERMLSMGLEPVLLHGREEVTLHAFDDAKQFHSRAEAEQAERQWQEKGVDVALIPVRDTLFMLGLGRLYQDKYAEDLQQQLDATGLPYRYQRRSVSIPTWRFSFPAQDRDKAEQLWRQLEDTGVVMPVLMRENRFQQLFSGMTGTE